MTTLLGIIAVILFMGIVGDDDKENKKYFTFAFIATLVAIVLLTR